MKKYSINDLISIRNWLSQQINTNTVPMDKVRAASKLVIDVDKEIWERLQETPILEVQDENFEETLKQISK